MVTQPVPGFRILGLYGVNSTGVVSFLFPFLAQSALISAETPLDFVGGGALHIVSDMGIYVQRSEYQQSSQVELLVYFFSGIGCLSISL